MKNLQLNEESNIPILGFGTWQLEGEQCEKSVSTALETGYRHIDTAEMYQNQKEIAKAVKDSGIKREDLFITSKVWRDNLKKEDLINACKKTLEELNTDYLDLYLIHWPNRDIPIEESLESMQELYEENLIRAIGVSNFTINHLKDALKTGALITNNQVEFHPSLYQKELLEFSKANGIHLTAYSPIAQGDDLALDTIKQIAEKYNKTESQIALAWLLKKNIIAIPRSSNEKHIRENFLAKDIELTDEDEQKIDDINENKRLINPPFGDFDY